MPRGCREPETHDTRAGRASEVLGEQVHQEAVVPAAVAAAFVLAQAADGTEADLLIRPDRAVVVGGRVDREAVMTALAHEPVDDGPEGLRTHALVRERRRERDVEAREAVVRIVLLVEAEPAGQLAVDLDGEGLPVAAEILLVRRLAPPLAR